METDENERKSELHIPAVVLLGISESNQSHHYSRCGLQEGSLHESLQWLRDCARIIGAPYDVSKGSFAQMSARGSAVFRECGRHRPLLARAALVLARVPIRDEGTTYSADVEEEEESDDDDGETMVEPLRQQDAQATVASFVLPGPHLMSDDEELLLSETLWNPEEVEGRHKRRRIEELQQWQPWRSCLKHEMHSIGQRVPPNISKQLGYCHGYYLPTGKSIDEVQAAQNLHMQQVLKIIGAKAQDLGFGHMSAERELRWWTVRYKPTSVDVLESGLLMKNNGLELMRRSNLPQARLYDIAEYYYKVWRTLHTPRAKEHYIEKAKRRQIEHKRREQESQPSARQQQQQVFATHRVDVEHKAVARQTARADGRAPGSSQAQKGGGGPWSGPAQSGLRHTAHGESSVLRIEESKVVARATNLASQS